MCVCSTLGALTLSYYMYKKSITFLFLFVMRRPENEATSLIGASLSEPHTSATALQDAYVCLYT